MNPTLPRSIFLPEALALRRSFGTHVCQIGVVGGDGRLFHSAADRLLDERGANRRACGTNQLVEEGTSGWVGFGRNLGWAM